MNGAGSDPLNAALTEILMQAYAHLGMPEASQRTCESLDRSLGLSDLGRASQESPWISGGSRGNVTCKV